MPVTSATSDVAPLTRFPDAPGLGATYLGDGQCTFTVWAPKAQQVELRLLKPDDEVGNIHQIDRPLPGRLVPMERDARGYFSIQVDGVAPGDRYMYRLDGHKERPDPASRFQPNGVHQPSQIVTSEFAWDAAGWSGIPLESYIVYELHVGTYTPEGTFASIIPHLDTLKELGVTAIEIMPVAQFPGGRNWGYDGAYLFAVQDSYGGPEGLKQLVNACHQRGLAVVLDVVYNHLGPEGNYLWDFGHYFTDRYHTPWGSAVNFDGAHSDEVRRFFLENVLYWITEFRIDALRLDAVHAIMDLSAYPFLEELGVAVQRQAAQRNRKIYTIAESDLNDTRIIRSRETGGFNLDTQWSDDFHHALHALLTGEQSGYYSDFGTMEHLRKAFADGYVYDGIYSEHRQRRHGNSSQGVPASNFVVCIQNHDQVGNRMHGDRLTQSLSFDALKLAAATVLLSPYIPMLFMGEEYGERDPFQYFVSHSDPGLVEAVRQGRKDEFASFAWQGEVPDPQSEATFQRSKLKHGLRQTGQHQVLFAWYKELIRLRTTLPALVNLSKEQMEVQSFEATQTLFVRRWHAGHEVCLVLHFGKEQAAVTLPMPKGEWRLVLYSAAESWQPAPDQAVSGGVLPDHILSVGACDLTVAPATCALFEKIG